MRIQRGHVCVSGSGKQQLCLIPRNLYEGCSEQLEKIIDVKVLCLCMS
jgi:hypothetical protein